MERIHSYCCSDFLQNVLLSGKFQVAEKDELVQWAEDPAESAEPMMLDTSLVDEPLYYQFQWNMRAIGAEGAWEAGYDGFGARVAVIDGGIYADHPDISPNLDRECSTSFVFDETGTVINFDQDVGTFWHGTHVAGIVAAAGEGVIGVAPRATLMHIKVLHGVGGYITSIIMGILFASDPQSFGSTCTTRADVINMSLGAVLKKNEKFEDPTGLKNPGLIGVVTKAANFAASKGVLVISSAGNLATDMGQNKSYVYLPAMAGSGLAISATGPVGVAYGATNYRRFASYSNYGEDLVSLAAPGGDCMLCANNLLIG